MPPPIDVIIAGINTSESTLRLQMLRRQARENAASVFEYIYSICGIIPPIGAPVLKISAWRKRLFANPMWVGEWMCADVLRRSQSRCLYLFVM